MQLKIANADETICENRLLIPRNNFLQIGKLFPDRYLHNKVYY